MIVHPKDWEGVGREIAVGEIEETLSEVIDDIDSNSIALSGGMDSSLLLWYLAEKYPEVYAYTIGKSENHPDVKYAKLAVEQFPNVIHRVFLPTDEEIAKEARKGEFPGDAAVRLFYKWLSQFTEDIIAGDGIDEYMAGYYAHQNSPNEETYYEFIRKMQDEQLHPLHKNSGDVNVYLPFIDERMISLMSQIPISEKVDSSERKKFMIKLCEGKMPRGIIERRKRGFVSALEDIDDGFFPGKIFVGRDLSGKRKKKKSLGSFKSVK